MNDLLYTVGSPSQTFSSTSHDLVGVLDIEVNCYFKIGTIFLATDAMFMQIFTFSLD